MSLTTDLLEWIESFGREVLADLDATQRLPLPRVSAGAVRASCACRAHSGSRARACSLVWILRVAAASCSDPTRRRYRVAPGTPVRGHRAVTTDAVRVGARRWWPFMRSICYAPGLRSRGGT